LSTNEPSRFSREFKLEALRRMEAGENVSVLARELGVSRKSIYQWRNRYRLGGGNALRSHRGRMTKAEVLAREEKPAAEKQPEKEARQTSLEEQARAPRRIAALERKIGQQQVELDFFQKTFRTSRPTTCGSTCSKKWVKDASHVVDCNGQCMPWPRNATSIPPLAG